MATQQLTGAPERTNRPTAQLPSAAAHALHVLELRLAFPETVVRAVVRFEIARDRKAELEAKPTHEWSAAEYDSWVDCDRVIAESRAVLAEAGLSHLAPPTLAETAARYETAAAHYRALAASADFDGCLAAQDEMGHCRCQLAAAGRLDLIGVS